MDNMNSDRRDFLSTMIKTAGVAAGAGLIGGTALHAKGGKGKKGGSQTSTSATTTLTEAQREALFYIFQEEKVARDVYITLGELYPEENTFAMIQLSEQRHIDAVGRLCETYGIEISEVDLGLESVGSFVLESLQTLYDTMITQGKIELIEALYVGKEIEITDIDDLEAAKEGMPDDVVKVLDYLLQGSSNHLAAFERAIERVEG